MQVIAVNPGFVDTSHFSRKRLHLPDKSSVALRIILDNKLLVWLGFIANKNCNINLFAASSNPTKVIEFVMASFLPYVALLFDRLTTHA